MLDPFTNLCQFDANFEKSQYMSNLYKTSRPSFCRTLPIFCSVYYLGCMVVNISAPFAEWSITKQGLTTLSYCCLRFFLAQNPPFIFRYRCCDGHVHFLGFGKYIFLWRQTCTASVLSADCTECSCSLDIVIFNDFLVFNFPFLNFEWFPFS